MRPDKPHQPWMQVWRDWLDRLPLRNEPAEPELPAASFGVAIPPEAAPRISPEASVADAAPSAPLPFPAATERRPPPKSP